MQKYHFHNRANREITDKESIVDILTKGKFATLSLCRNNEPYIVTLSYGYDKELEYMYFHCAIEGLKIDFIKSNPNICGTVIEDGGYIENECGHWYRTAIFWGTIEILEEIEEKRKGMEIILNQLEKNVDVKNKKLNSSPELYDKVVVLRLKISSITAKAGR